MGRCWETQDYFRDIGLQLPWRPTARQTIPQGCCATGRWGLRASRLESTWKHHRILRNLQIKWQGTKPRISLFDVSGCLRPGSRPGPPSSYEHVLGKFQAKAMWNQCEMDWNGVIISVSWCIMCMMYHDCAGHLEEYQDPDALDHEGERGETAAYKAARNGDVHKLELLYLACANFDLQASRPHPNLNNLKATISEQPKGNDAPDQLEIVKCFPAVYNCCHLWALWLSNAICSLEQHPAVSFTGQGIVRLAASVASVVVSFVSTISCQGGLQDLVFRIMLNLPNYKKGYRHLPPTPSPRQSDWAWGFKNVTVTSPKGYCLTLLAEPSRKIAVEPKSSSQGGGSATPKHQLGEGSPGLCKVTSMANVAFWAL